MRTSTAKYEDVLAQVRGRPTEMRRGPRTITVYRIGRLSAGSDAGLCRLHDISDHGAMLMTSLAAEVGAAVVLSLTDSVHLPGKVVWTDGVRLGLEFSAAIDAAALLKSLAAGQRAGSERPARLPTNTTAAAVTPYGTRAVTVRNISQHGMQVAHDGSFEVGLPVKVMLENGLERRGIVMWSKDSLAGLRLLEPIGYRELERASAL